MRRHTIALLCAVTVAAVWSTSRAHDVARLGFAGAPVSDIVFPAQQIPLAFSHVQHLSRVKLNCAFCHEDIEESKSSLDNNIPKEDVCQMCHEIDRNDPDKQVADGEPAATCVTCHPGYKTGEPVARVRIPNPNIKFNHEVHVDEKIRCQACHGELDKENVALATREQLPKMMLCLQCHDDKQAPAACTTCHLAEGNGLMQTEYPEGVLKPSGVLRGDGHGMAFVLDHASVAVHDEAYCENCHRKDFCVGCHNGTQKPMAIHDNDYLTLHTIDARRNNPNCSSCHRTQTFCVGCHSRSGVAYDGKGGEFQAPFLTGNDTVRFHPEAWVQFGDRTANHHAFEAQKNIKQCTSCHRAQFCTTCHSNEPSNAFKITPHPADWVGSRRCKSLANRNRRMCLRCHIDPDEVRCN